MWDEGITVCKNTLSVSKLSFRDMSVTMNLSTPSNCLSLSSSLPLLESIPQQVFITFIFKMTFYSAELLLEKDKKKKVHSYCPVSVRIWTFDINIKTKVKVMKFRPCTFSIHWLISPLPLVGWQLYLLILTSNFNFKQIINFAISSLWNVSFSCQY